MDISYGDKARNTKQLLMCTDYLNTDEARNGGGNLLLAECAAEIATMDAVTRCLELVDEKCRRLFRCSLLDLVDQFIQDQDQTIVIPIIRFSCGRRDGSIIGYNGRLWILIKENKIKDKQNDISICIGHWNHNGPKRTLKALKGSKVSREEQTKRILLNQGVWKYLQALKHARNCTKNYIICAVVVEFYYFITKTKEFDINKKYVICYGGNLIWEQDDDINDSIQELENVDLNEDLSHYNGHSFVRFIENNDISSSDHDSLKCCSECDAYFVYKKDSADARAFRLVLCPKCKAYTPVFTGSKSKQLLEIPLIAGNEHSDDILSCIKVRSREIKDGLTEICTYLGLVNLQLSVIVCTESLTNLVPNAWFSDKLDHLLSLLFMTPMILPCFKIHKHGDELHTDRTSATAECTIKYKKRPGTLTLPQYLSYTNKFMLDRIDRVTFSQQVPRKETKRNRKRKVMDQETPWKKNMSRDDELEYALDCFKNHYKLGTMAQVITSINQLKDDDGYIDAYFIQKAVNKKNLNDTKRNELMDLINRCLKKRVRYNSNRPHNV